MANCRAQVPCSCSKIRHSQRRILLVAFARHAKAAEIVFAIIVKAVVRAKPLQVALDSS